MKKLFVATVYATQKFDGEIVESKLFKELECNNIKSEATSNDIVNLAIKLVNEAKKEKCTHFAIHGEPCLMFHAWNLAKVKGLTVIQPIIGNSWREI